ncbi:metalloregulator ArsR/SmtB family transcription factor [Pendulispora albinea]|uniref:Metalloregulator ArsR/SmtB family transcription factor n=1 Tax=Pendulispora albinea TaxID=2741071 RepID=A0ABZ2M5T3_9BACT
MLESALPPNRWDLYRVLSEPVRLRLLALAAEEELAIGELAELLGESQPNVSRHIAPLKQAGLVVVRKQGTRALVRLRDGATADAVIADALASGRSLCEADCAAVGTSVQARIDDVLRARDAVAREYFAAPRAGGANGAVGDSSAGPRPPVELGAYLAALAVLLPRRGVAVDVGTGDGGLLEVLAPVFERVIALDRSGVQLAEARARVKARGFSNVTLLEGDLAGDEARRAVGQGADVVFAARLLHHAAKPAALVQTLAALVAPGGSLVVLDYARHEDESMRNAADLWLGFEPAELKKFARAAGLERALVVPLSSALITSGPDHHLPWQVLVATKPTAHPAGEAAAGT